MSLKLETLSASDTLAAHEATISGIEALGYELITFARGVVSGAKSNTATFRLRSPGNAPGPLTLVRIDETLALPGQDAAVNAGETGGKILISYAAVFVAGAETNVAAYRG
jgi:hypothetical protein